MTTTTFKLHDLFCHCETAVSCCIDRLGDCAMIFDFLLSVFRAIMSLFAFDTKMKWHFLLLSTRLRVITSNDWMTDNRLFFWRTVCCFFLLVNKNSPIDGNRGALFSRIDEKMHCFVDMIEMKWIELDKTELNCVICAEVLQSIWDRQTLIKCQDDKCMSDWYRRRAIVLTLDHLLIRRFDCLFWSIINFACRISVCRHTTVCHMSKVQIECHKFPVESSNVLCIVRSELSTIDFARVFFSFRFDSIENYLIGIAVKLLIKILLPAVLLTIFFVWFTLNNNSVIRTTTRERNK